MRIISKFKDYYDCGQAWDQDKSVVYVRDLVEITKEPYCKERGRFRNLTIGFCGKFYTVFHVCMSVKSSIDQYGNYKTAESYCYDISDCDKFADDYFDDYDKNQYYGIEQKKKGNAYSLSWDSRRKYLEQFFSANEPREIHPYSEDFHKHKSPVIVYERNRTVINANLKNYEFFKVKEPYTAYNEISQYVGGVLQSPVKPIPEISDEVIQEIKGFDHEYSFRKEPSKSTTAGLKTHRLVIPPLTDL